MHIIQGNAPYKRDSFEPVGIFLTYPFALVAKQVDPLDERVTTPIWRKRKAIGSSLEEARSQS